VDVGGVGVGGGGPAAGGVGQAQAMAEGVLGVGLGLRVAPAGLLLLGDQALNLARGGWYPLQMVPEAAPSATPTSDSSTTSA
jgi:hypothetical protein